MKRLPSLRQLRYLCALEEHLHFGRAAEACAVTQSTLSAGLQELEAALSAPLVERTKRRVLLTPSGREVAARARGLLRAAEDLVDAAQGSGEPLSGDLRLGLIPTVGPYLLPRILPNLRAAYPKLKLYLREDQTAALLEQLQAGRLDAVVLALPYDIGDLETATIAQDPLLLLCPSDHPLAARPEVDAASLKDAPLLLLEGGHCLRDHALHACQLRDADRHETFQGTSLRTLVPMVASGLGVTLVPSMALEAEAPEDSGLVARPLKSQAGARQIALAWRRGSPRAAEFRLLGQALADALRPVEHKRPAT